MSFANDNARVILLGAFLCAASGASSSAQNVTLPPGSIVSGPVAYGQSLWSADCGGGPGSCKGKTYPSIINGFDADAYLSPYTAPSTTTPPFINSVFAPASVVWTSAPTQYIRVWGGGSKEVGSWVAPANQIRGMTPDQIKDVLALPTAPTNQSIVALPAGTCMLVGKAGPITNSQQVAPLGFWGNGGATQAFLIGKSPNGCGPGSGQGGNGPNYTDASDFFNGQPLGYYALAYVPRAGSGNAGAVAFALDHAVFPAQFTDADGVYNALDILNYGQNSNLRYALTQLDGEVNSNIQSVVIASGRMFLEALHDQTHLARMPAIRRLPNGWRPWVSALGGGGYFNGSENYRGLNFSGGGGSFGADYLFAPEVQIGLSGAFTRSSFATNGVSGSGNVDSYAVGSYAGYASHNIYFDAAVGYAYNQAAVARTISFPGVSRVAASSPSNDSLLSRAELGYNIRFTEQFRAAPFVAFQGIVAFAKAFSESGAGDISLNVLEKNLATATSTAGAELSYSLPIGYNAPLTLSGRAGWTHDFADVKRKTWQNFQGILRSNFWAEGAAWPQNAATVGVKMVMPVEQVDLFLRYDGLFANNTEISSATGGFTMRF